MTNFIKCPASLPPGSDVIAYCRDSGGPAQESSIAQQQRDIEEYCQQNGLTISRIYSDSASGRSIKNRQQFLEMFHTIETMPEDLRPRGLLLWAYSRFSRDFDQFNYYLYGLKSFGVFIHSITEEVPDGIAGQFMLSAKAVINADFSVQLGKQIKRGIENLVRSGFSNGGQAPRGYRVVREVYGHRRNGQPRIGVRWEIDPDLAPLVRLAWEMRAQGKGYGEITKATQGKVYTNKNSWSTHFENRSYLGIGKAGSVEVENHHDPIITPEIWEAVKRVEESMPRHGWSGKMMHHRRVKHPSLLSGLAFCIYCGAAMTLHTSNKYRYYVCGKHDRQRTFSECPTARRVSTHKADQAIFETVLSDILSPAYVSALLADIQNQLANTKPLDQELEESYKLTDQNKRSVTRLMSLAETTGDLDEIAQRLKELKHEKTELDSRIKNIKSAMAIQSPQLTPDALALVFATWREQIESNYQQGEILQAKKLLSYFVSKIEMSRETAIIHYTYPLVKAEDTGPFSAHF